MAGCYRHIKYDYQGPNTEPHECQRHQWVYNRRSKPKRLKVQKVSDQKYLKPKDPHPNIFDFIGCLREEQSRTESVLAKLLMGEAPQAVKKASKKKDARVKRIVQKDCAKV